ERRLDEKSHQLCVTIHARLRMQNEASIEKPATNVRVARHRDIPQGNLTTFSKQVPALWQFGLLFGTIYLVALSACVRTVGRRPRERSLWGVAARKFKENPLDRVTHWNMSNEQMFSLRPSSIHGIGVFAVKPIKKGQHLPLFAEDEEIILTKQKADYCVQD